MSAADDLVEALVAVHAAGGRLRLVDGRVRVDVDVELPESVWTTLAAHREELVAIASRGGPIWDSSPIWPPRGLDRDKLPMPAGLDACERCRSTETIDQPIHGGRSVRRDCAVCGRFRKFTVWNGDPMP
jgi:hypothetical protein